MIVIPKNKEETAKFCQWLDTIQYQPVSFSCHRYFENQEDQNIIFWYMDQKQWIICSKEFIRMIPLDIPRISVRRFKDIVINRNNDMIGLHIFSHLI